MELLRREAGSNKSFGLTLLNQLDIEWLTQLVHILTAYV